MEFAETGTCGVLDSKLAADLLPENANNWKASEKYLSFMRNVFENCSWYGQMRIVRQDDYYSKICGQYYMDSEPEVREFLFSNFALMTLLSDAAIEAEKIFDNCRPKMRVFNDLEEGWSRLILTIPYGRDDKAILERKFFEDWVLPNRKELKGKVGIVVE